MSASLPDNVKKYLTKYGAKTWKISIKENINFDYIIVVPTIAEYENIIRLLNSLSENNFKNNYRVALVFVVNNSISSPEEVKADNEKTIELLKAILNNNSSFHPVIEKFSSSGIVPAFVDASSDGLELPEKTAGVGLARKTGMDLSLELFDYSNTGKKIIICLDADCTVKKNYLNEIINFFNKNSLNIAIIDYEHPLPEDEESKRAIICYEIFLRYYELGLKYAGSKYAFQAVGSTMVCDYEAYIKVEGMNKRKAGEDFYFLEKLAKNYKIEKINSTKVFPSARPSWRVPFGTGQRINRFLSKTQNEYLLYNPECFNILKRWLEVFQSDNVFSGKDYLLKSKEIHPEFFCFLEKQNFEDDWDKILLNSKDDYQITLQKHRWFDGFRTFKLIHHLRDTAFPLINMFDALDNIFNQCNLPPINNRGKDIPDISMQLEYLQALKKYS